MLKTYCRIKFGPGSIVTRQRPALASARLLAPTQIPVVVVTNCENAEILNGSTGRAIATDLEAIPSRSQIIKRVGDEDFHPIFPVRAELESRIIYAFEVDGSCPCDDTICRL